MFLIHVNVTFIIHHLISFCREYHTRGDIVWNSNDTVTFKNIRKWIFDERKSNGRLDDLITNINIVPAVSNIINTHCHVVLRYTFSS